MKKILVVAMAFALAIMLSGCGKIAPDNSEVGLLYGHGPVEGKKFKRCMKPGESIQSNDKMYPYPANQRNWKFQTGGRGADEQSINFISSDGVPMTAVVTVAFELNTSCKDITVAGKDYKGGVLQLFHEQVAKTRHAYFKTDGTYQTYPASQDKGWAYVVSQAVGLPVRKLFRTYGTRYGAAALWLNTQTDAKVPTDDSLEEYIQNNLEKASNDFTETDEQFFQNFKVEITDIQPDTNSGFAQQYNDRKLAQTKADTAQLNKQALVTEAEANAAVQRAKIAGFPSYDAYLKAQMVEKGMNPLQPTYVVGGTGPTK